MLVIECDDCGKAIETINHVDIAKYMQYIVNTYYSKKSNLCNDCWLKMERANNELNKIIKSKEKVK